MRPLLLLLSATLVAGCTLAPCLNRQCAAAPGEVNGSLTEDVVGQWVSTDLASTDLWELRRDGTGRSIVVCDNGEYTTPGSTSSFTWRVEGKTLRLNSSDAGQEIASVTAETMVLVSPAVGRSPPTSSTWQRSRCTGRPFE